MLRKLADEAELPQTLASRLMPAALAGSLGLIYGATQAPGDSILRGALIGGLGGAGAGLGFSAGNAFMESDAAKNMRSPGIGAGMALGGGALGLHGGLLAGRAISKRTGLGDEDDRTSDDLKEMDLMRNAKHLPAGLSDYVKRSNAPALGPGLMNQLAGTLGYVPKAQAAPSPIVQQQPAPTPPKPGGLSSMGTLGYAGLGGGAAAYAAHRDLPGSEAISNRLYERALGEVRKGGVLPTDRNLPDTQILRNSSKANTRRVGDWLSLLPEVPGADGGPDQMQSILAKMRGANAGSARDALMKSPGLSRSHAADFQQGLLKRLAKPVSRLRGGAVGLGGVAGALGLTGLGNYLYSGQPKQAAEDKSKNWLPDNLSTPAMLGYGAAGGGAAGYFTNKYLPSVDTAISHAGRITDQLSPQQLTILKNVLGGVRVAGVARNTVLGGLGAAGLGGYLHSSQPKQASDSINRQLDPEELAQIAKGKQQIVGDMFPTEFDPIPKQMRSPTAAGVGAGALTGVPTGLAGGIIGALLTGDHRSSKAKILGALAGALGVGGAIGGGTGALAYHSQDAKNRELEGWMKRLPKGSAMRDTVYDPAAHQRQLFEHQRQTFGQRPAK